MLAHSDEQQSKKRTKLFWAPFPSSHTIRVFIKDVVLAPNLFIFVCEHQGLTDSPIVMWNYTFCCCPHINKENIKHTLIPSLLSSPVAIRCFSWQSSEMLAFFHCHQALFSGLTQSALNCGKLFLSLILDLKQMEVEFQISYLKWRIIYNNKAQGPDYMQESNCRKLSEGMRLRKETDRKRGQIQ